MEETINYNACLIQIIVVTWQFSFEYKRDSF